MEDTKQPAEGAFILEDTTVEVSKKEEFKKDLVEKVKKRKALCQNYYDELWRVSEDGKRYWEGRQIDIEDLYEGEEPIVVNRVFMTVETIIPIATRRNPEPVVEVIPRTKKNRHLKEKLENLLTECWMEDNKMPLQLERALRILFTGRYAGFKYFYDPENRRLKLKLLPRGTLMFPKEAYSAEQSPYLIELVTERLGDICMKFPDVEEELKKAVSPRGNLSEDTLVTYLEYWQDDMCAWVYKDLLLGAFRNPNFNYNTPEFNFFIKPQKPYEILNFLSFGDSIADPVSMIEQVKSLQNSINKRKRQIELNAGLANGKIVSSGDYMDKETFDAIQNTPQEKIYLEKGDPNKAVAYLFSRAYDSGIYSDLVASENEIDNIMGTHSTTRGEKTGQETATGRSLLKDSDEGRLDLLLKQIESLAERLYGDLIQLMYVYCNEPYPIDKITTEKNSVFEITEKERDNNLINTEFKGLRVRVRVDAGSATPKDRASERQEAIDLFKLGLLSTKDTLEILQYPNPESLAKNAVMEKINPEFLFPSIVDGDSFDVEAIQHLKEVIDYGVDISQEEYITQVQDPELLNKHIRTHTDYIRGIEISEDFKPFSELDDQTVSIISKHVQAENNLLKQMLSAISLQTGMTASGQPGMPSAFPKTIKEEQAGGQQMQPQAKAPIPQGVANQPRM